MNLDSAKFEIACPRCSYKFEISFKEVKDNSVVICAGCLSNITLKNEDKSANKTENLLKNFLRNKFIK